MYRYTMDVSLDKKNIVDCKAVWLNMLSLALPLFDSQFCSTVRVGKIDEN